MIMRRAMLIVSVFGCSVNDASQWIFIGMTSNQSMAAYVDRASITRRDKDVFSAWVMHDYAPSHKQLYGGRYYQSIKMLGLFWCGDRLMKTVTSTAYSGSTGEGVAVATEDVASRISPVIPDTLGEHTLRFVCDADVRIKDTNDWLRMGVRRMPFDEEVKASADTAASAASGTDE